MDPHITKHLVRGILVLVHHLCYASLSMYTTCMHVTFDHPAHESPHGSCPSGNQLRDRVDARLDAYLGGGGVRI